MANLDKVAANLQARGFRVVRCDTAKQAGEEIFKLVGETETIGIGGSVSAQESGIADLLAQRGNDVAWHWLTPMAEDAQVYRRAEMADVYIASVNALLENGVFINIDGSGNRVASLAYGHNRVFIIAGRNKVVEGNLQDGIARAKKDACGKNARRLGLKTPCAVNDVCTDCRTPHRMCKVTTITEYPPNLAGEWTVFLVDDEVGY